MRLFQRLSAAAVSAALAGLAPLQAAAQPSTAADDADLKCMLVVGAMMSAPGVPDAMKSYGPMAFTYYYGKVKGRSPALDIESRIIALTGEMQGKDIRPEAQRCGAELQTVGQETKAMGARLQNLGAAPAKP